jgi:hypothetical protein
MKGRAELQSGAVLFLVGAVGLALLRLWGTSPRPTGAGTVFTANGYVSAVATIVLLGVLVIGAGLLVLGGILRLVQRSRDARMKDR